LNNTKEGARFQGLGSRNIADQKPAAHATPTHTNGTGSTLIDTALSARGARPNAASRKANITGSATLNSVEKIRQEARSPEDFARFYRTVAGSGRFVVPNARLDLARSTAVRRLARKVASALGRRESREVKDV
jgi:hypothetical protein